MAAGCLGSGWHVKLVPRRYIGVCKRRSAGRQIVTKAYSLAKSQKLYLGLDFGSSGARAICIDGTLFSLWLQHVEKLCYLTCSLMQMSGMSFMTQGQSTKTLKYQDGAMHGKGQPDYTSSKLGSLL